MGFEIILINNFIVVYLEFGGGGVGLAVGSPRSDGTGGCDL